MAALLIGGLCVISACVLLSLRACDRDRKAGEEMRAQVGAQVVTTQIEEAEAIATVTEEARGQITTIQDRTRRDVARVREAGARAPVVPAPGDGGPDPVERAFFDG